MSRNVGVAICWSLWGDIIPYIFQNYNKKPVMLIALPVAVKFLQKGNAEMSRNLASYLSLAAIEYASLLSPHVQPILDSICTDANYGLCRLLPQIYEVSPEQLNGSVAPLVLLLPRCDVAERLALLQLFALMARQRPAVLEAYVPQLCEQLANGQMAQATMQVLLPLAEHVATAAPIAEQFSRLRAAALESPSTVTLTAQIMAAAGKVNKVRLRHSRCDSLIVRTCALTALQWRSQWNLKGCSSRFRIAPNDALSGPVHVTETVAVGYGNQDIPST